MSSTLTNIIYNNPPLTKRLSTVYNYENSPVVNPAEESDHFELSSQSIIKNYPKTAEHARHPIMISCPHCNKLTMTETENQFGVASGVWCCLLMPVLCMGMCCVCSDTCKDVSHICSDCRKQVGVSRSNVC